MAARGQQEPQPGFQGAGPLNLEQVAPLVLNMKLCIEWASKVQMGSKIGVEEQAKVHESIKDTPVVALALMHFIQVGRGVL